MSWGTELWDQFDNLEKHTQWGIEVLEKYIKFVKERTEIEINYAKQLRNLSKKYQTKKNSKEEDEFKYTSCKAFQTTLNEMNDYAGQHELISENMSSQITAELTRFVQELKQERKSNFHEGRKAQQHIETCWKQLESSKRRFERDCKEADRAQQYFEKMDADINVTKADVEKARQQAQIRHQMADDSKGDYSSVLQKFNCEQHDHYFTHIPSIYQKLQDMEERRIGRLGESLKTYAEIDRQVIPIIGKCLDEITKSAESINQKQDSHMVIEAYKSGFEPPGDIDFEDFTQSIKRTVSDTSLTNPKTDGKSDLKLSSKSRGKLWPFIKKNKGATPEDFSNLPPEQRRKKLQQKVDELNKDIQKEIDQSPDGSYTEDHSQETEVKVTPTEFDDDFDEEEPLPTIGTCKALYPFDGENEGTISVTEGEILSVIEEDKGDGWTRIRRSEEEEGYVPTSYIEVYLDRNAKDS
ncbi:hypothetical protein GDO86_015011 [Hymenochirus boettgeri]|uniref:Formin binding protein 1 n=1 Tax=Hymenochirus boettgeri TaxID=247094 RepID=A0A8T2JR27_9PIPI|nr:hypothetical protein GDO86_015011 [Hymenochirus boettgeri]